MWCIALAAAGWSAALLAHHSISVVEIGAPQWVKDTVTAYQLEPECYRHARPSSRESPVSASASVTC